MWTLSFTVHLGITKVSIHVLYKYQPSSGQSSSLLMKASCLRLKLVELNFFTSFTTDDQSIFICIKHIKHIQVVKMNLFNNIIKSLKRYRYELFTLESNVLLVKRGDLQWPQSHRVTHSFTLDFICRFHEIRQISYEILWISVKSCWFSYNSVKFCGV